MKPFARTILFYAGTLLGPWLIRILGATWRVQWVDAKHHEECRAEGRSVILAIWHGRLLPLAYTHRNRNIQILISRHQDGEIIRRVTKHLGSGSVRGSTGKGGARAILQMAKKAKEGCDLAITPDGPRGPRGVAQAGVLLIAQRAGIPVVPLTSASSRKRMLSSWDGFQIPAPFARLVVAYGAPIEIPEDLDEAQFELARQRVESAMLHLTARADRIASGEEEVTP